MSSFPSPTPGWHIAQANWARMRTAGDDPAMDDFVARLDPINALADRSPGFVWRLVDENGNSNAIRPFDDDRILFNMSVWRSIDELYDYTYRQAHVRLIQARGKWFETPDRAPHVLWWVPGGDLPSVEEGCARLEHLWEHGPSARAFTFRERFPAPAGAPRTAAESRR